MGPATALWTEAKIDFTVTREFVLKHVDPILHPRLNSKIAFGEGLTDDTYIEWILQRGRRLFLILVEIEVPSRIFRLVDETYDDSDLPFDSNKAELLRLSPDREDLFLNWRFVEVQNRFLARGIEAGQHITYDEDETIPVDVCKERPAVVLSDRLPVEKVSLPGIETKEYLRVKIAIGEDTASHFLSESDVLREVRSLERFSHEHILSISGTYTAESTVNVLFHLPECNLRSFINDRHTSALRKFSKLEQKRWLVNWPNCLASGLAWLHDQGYAHGAIRPSNILIDAKMHIYLGLFDVHDLLVGLRKEEFAEAYEYAAPEQWSNQHCAWQQPPGGTRNALTRTDNLAFSPLTSQKGSYDTRGRLTSWGSSSDFSSVGPSRKRASYAHSTSTTSTHGSNQSATFPSPPQTIPNNSHCYSAEQLPLASDVFSLAAVILDIITHLCKRKQSAFAQHRGCTSRTKSSVRSTNDTSFHLDQNTRQIFSWIAILEKDAAKQSESYFHAVDPILEAVKEMFARDPKYRPRAAYVADKFAMAILQIDFGSTQPHCQVKQSDGVIGSLRSFDMSEESDIPIPPMPTFPEDYSCYAVNDKATQDSNKLPNITYTDSSAQLGGAETDSYTDLSNGSISLYTDDSITSSSSVYGTPLTIATPATPAPPAIQKPWNVHIVNSGGEFDDKNIHPGNDSAEIIDEMMEDMHLQTQKSLPPLPVPTSHPWYVPSRVSSLFNSKPTTSHTSSPLQHSYPDKPFEDSGLGIKPTIPPRHPNRPRANTGPNQDHIAAPRSDPDDFFNRRRSNSSFGSNNGGSSGNTSPIDGISGRFSLLTSSRPSTSYGSSISGLTFKKRAFMNFSRGRPGLRTPPPV
ncbi:protein kinase domain-containing protein [Trichophyton verrucosum HKI 0517]|uniref:Protein kinase domain-containing protein n=1 Tax=Trichophyton verrucosum (strain HKI 0517) TaxID=663202 RepID=D4D3P4_TRIVH|nr:protein kinase domain-containing protein [Trichophyton verrucosum HKI 0517]EFE43535.1 protein kinase domain-containing protein [Trichophyton verrucosum HKI 0517]